MSINYFHIIYLLYVWAGLVRNNKALAAANLQEPIISNLWSAGFSFSKCHAEHKVPPDPHLHQCWDGEEFAKYARYLQSSSSSSSSSISSLLISLSILISLSLSLLFFLFFVYVWCCRLWTRGYDVYTPHKIIATHDYSPSKVDPYIGPNRPGGPAQFDWTANGTYGWKIVALICLMSK